jgi:hypothetical protein
MFQNKKIRCKNNKTKLFPNYVNPSSFFTLYSFFSNTPKNYSWKKKNPNVPSQIKFKSLITIPNMP